MHAWLHRALVLCVIGVIGVAGLASGSGWPGPDGAGYVGEVTPYDLGDGTGTGFPFADENVQGPIGIGFSFPFYAATHDEVSFSSNGFMAFGPVAASPVNQCSLPDAAGPDGLIAPMWDDLEGGWVVFERYSPGFCPYGTYARACFVAQWQDIYHAPSSGLSLAGTFEVVLLENGDIIMQFEDTGDEAGSGSTTGIEGYDSGSDHGLTYVCNTGASLADGDAIRFRADIGVVLSPDHIEIDACEGKTHPVTLNLVNRTGSASTFDLAYDVPSGNATLTGPSSLAVPDGAVAPFTAELSIPSCASGGTITATITASGNGRSNSSVITAEPGPMSVISVPNSNPPWEGEIFTTDGCTALNDQDQWVTWVLAEYPQTGFPGLWGYNHETGSWVNPPVGTPPIRYDPDWAYDPDANLCYLTGGIEQPSHQFLPELWRLDPVGVSFTNLMTNMTTPRARHASWVATIDGTRVLCVGGGQGAAGIFDSTQCYDIAMGSWLAENATLGAMPLTIAPAADGVNRIPGGNQLWISGGWQGGMSSDDAHYFDDATDSWEDGGSSGTNVALAGGGFLNGAFYQFGGATDSPYELGPNLRATFDGAAWQWEQLTVNARPRYAPVVAELPGRLAVVTGNRQGSPNLVEVFEPCPGCLRGVVSDLELPPTSPTCTQAEILIEPGSIQPGVDPATGTWGPVELPAGEVELTADAPGYEPNGPVPVAVFPGGATIQDLALQRPVATIDPSTIEVTWPAGFGTVRRIAVTNDGHLPMGFDLTETPPVDWLTIVPTSGVIPAFASQPVDLTLTCLSVGDFGTVALVTSNDPCQPETPLQVTLHCAPDGIFADGFEAGDTNAWTSTSP